MNRNDFPFFTKHLHGIQKHNRWFDPNSRTTERDEIIYLDSAATSQMPKCVFQAEEDFQQFYRANVHRGIHWMSDKSTEQLEQTRKIVARLVNSSPAEIVFTKGATEAINIVAHGLKSRQVFCSHMEHHANIVSWQLFGAEMIPFDLHDEDPFASAIDGAVLAITGASNVLGTKTDLKSLIKKAKSAGLKTLVDASQLVVHDRIDVKELDCDFLVFSGHKLYGPTGTGILYGKTESLKTLPPMQGGGEMISSVSFEKSSWNEIPYRFEAGTPNIGGLIGLGTAVEYFEKHFDAMQTHEQLMTAYTMDRLFEAGVNVLGPTDPVQRVPVFAFEVPDVHCHDVAQLLDQQGIAVRSGYHCTEPLHKYLGVPGTCRASLAMYSETSDIDALCLALEKTRGFF